ncbi:hypothetical protein D3C83_248610 [compost metagenome]
MHTFSRPTKHRRTQGEQIASSDHLWCLLSSHRDPAFLRPVVLVGRRVNHAHRRFAFLLFHGMGR